MLIYSHETVYISNKRTSTTHKQSAHFRLNREFYDAHTNAYGIVAGSDKSSNKNNRPILTWYNVPTYPRKHVSSDCSDRQHEMDDYIEHKQ